MIGLAQLPNGAHTLRHPAGALFVRVRHRSIVYAELAAWGDRKLVAWSIGPLSTAERILAGYLALAERVVAPSV